jgi:hypothetical protein
LGFESFYDITVDRYDEICEIADDSSQPEIYNAPTTAELIDVSSDPSESPF